MLPTGRSGAASSASTSPASAVCISAHTRPAPTRASTLAVSAITSPASSTDIVSG